ncbi:MAG: hypothetical protein ACUVXG_06300 [Anaerolineae bacterium]
MNISVADNTSRQRELFSILSRAVESAQEARVATACVSSRGFLLVEPAVKTLLGTGGAIEFLIGLDLSGTDPDALWQIHQLAYQNPGRVSWYCFRDLSPGVIYHPKLYLTQTPTQFTAIGGASNLTEGGLRRNVEVNLVLQAQPEEEVFSDLWASYNELKFKQPRICPDEEFIRLFEDLHGEVSQTSGVAREDRRVLELRRALREKAVALAPPQPGVSDLHGWQRLVYERLPTGKFQTSDIYKWERDFRKRYPGNQNVRAKIRQVLQQLRDMGLLQHKGHGVWFHPSP